MLIPSLLHLQLSISDIAKLISYRPDDIRLIISKYVPNYSKLSVDALQALNIAAITDVSLQGEFIKEVVANGTVTSFCYLMDHWMLPIDGTMINLLDIIAYCKSMVDTMRYMWATIVDISSISYTVYWSILHEIVAVREKNRILCLELDSLALELSRASLTNPDAAVIYGGDYNCRQVVLISRRDFSLDAEWQSSHDIGNAIPILDTDYQYYHTNPDPTILDIAHLHVVGGSKKSARF